MSILTTPNAAGACVDGPFNSLSHEALGRQQLEARLGEGGRGGVGLAMGTCKSGVEKEKEGGI